jgi:hypothetical protein
MAAGGSSGPTRGAYFPLTFATANLATSASAAGVTIGAWTVPTGAEYVITDVQGFCTFSGSFGLAGAVGQVQLFANSIAVCSSAISLATGSSVSGTLATSTGVRAYSGQTISATAFAPSTIQHVVQIPTVRVMGYVVKHPSSVFGNFGSADVPSVLSFGP